MAQINWNHRNISKLPKEKVLILKTLSDNLTKQNLKPNQTSFSYIFALSKQLKEANITFTPEEYTLIVGAIQK
jgi:hypothetical protein